MIDTAPLRLPASAVVTDLDPLILTSPAPRSGTTLLQRLVCSAPGALVFGEKCAQDLEFFLNIYAYKVQEYTFLRVQYRQETEQVLRGEVNDWINNLFPDVDGYLRAIQQAAFAGIAYCREFALRAGRPVWGFKYPGWDPATIRLLKAVMPGARFLFIYRDLIPSLKSARAQHLVTNEQETRDFCQKWAAGMAFWKGGAGVDLGLVIDYGDLVEHSNVVIEKISAYAGVQDMDRSVLDHKINTWTGQEFANQAKDGYIPPAELSPAELAIAANYLNVLG